MPLLFLLGKKAYGLTIRAKKLVTSTMELPYKNEAINPVHKRNLTFSLVKFSQSLHYTIRLISDLFSIFLSSTNLYNLKCLTISFTYYHIIKIFN